MKTINVLISCVGAQARPGYCYLLERYREFNVIAESGELYGSSVWVGLSHCDVLVIDEGVIDQYGFQALRSVIASYPRIKVLLIQENESQLRALTAVAQGIQGVMTQASSCDMLHKAVIALYSGEAWVSRGLLPGIHMLLKFKHNNPSVDHPRGTNDSWAKLN
ncbi:MAG: hypothetical protein WBO06_14810 [Gammaproteobacteria bacterium]|jgi:two-component system invasion response regulator UvrY